MKRQIDFGGGKGKLKAIINKCLELVLALAWRGWQLIRSSPLPSFHFVGKVKWKISPEYVPWPLCLTSFLYTLQREQACRYGSYCKVDPSCVMVAPVAYASHGHMCALVGWTVQLPGLAELQGWQGGVGWAGMPIGPPHLPLLAAGTMYCSSFGCTWKDLAPSPALMVLGTAQPHQPSQLLSAQILGSQGFSVIVAFGRVLSQLPGLQSVLVGEDLPMASSRSCFPSLGFALLGIPMFLLHFLACGCSVYATSIFPGTAFFALTLFSAAGCLCYIFDL